MKKIFGEIPFTLTDEMALFVRNLTFNSQDNYSKAELIFGWMSNNIQYDSTRRGMLNRIIHDYSYKPSHEVFETRIGICLDQAYLYTTLARYAGLDSSIVDVKKDNHNDSVSHACSSVRINGYITLVDIAYHTFNIHHREYRIMPDSEVKEEYLSIKHTYEPEEETTDELDYSNPFTYPHPAPVFFDPLIPNYAHPAPNYQLPCSPSLHQHPSRIIKPSMPAVIRPRKQGLTAEHIFYSLILAALGGTILYINIADKFFR